TASDAIVVDEYVVAMLGKVLENCQPPWLVGAAVTDENRLLDASHHCVSASAIGSRAAQLSNGLAPSPEGQPLLAPFARAAALLVDETCWFLAADFDRDSWQTDALAF